MRYVNKGVEPQSFANWKGLENEDWSPSYGALANPEKKDLLNALLAEQFHRCCYCGASISPGTAHIEHFRPQELFGDLQLAFPNLHASCLREVAPGTPTRCGHAKANWFDEECFIDPQDPACESRFRYLGDGSIDVDRLDLSAKKMVEVLRLDLEFFNNAREDVLAGVFDENFLDTADEDQLRRIITAWGEPDAFGKQSTFCHVVIRFAQQLLAPPELGWQ